MAGVKYIAPLFDASGYAEAARNYALALHGQGYPVTLAPTTSWAPPPDLGSDGEVLKELVGREIEYDKIIVHRTPDAWRHEQESEPGRFAIGLTVWETSVLHPVWVKACNRFDEVWVPSRWNADIFRESGVTVPVQYIPHAIEPPALDGVEPLEIDGVSDNDFVFYSIFHWQERKNPRALVECFLATFSGERDVVLVLKTFADEPWENKAKIDDLVSEVKSGVNLMRYPRIVTIVANLAKDDILRLHRRGDCFALFQRAEGWGLPHFEAAACGKPVITTSLGGPADFLSEETGYLLDYSLRPVTGMAWSSYYSARGKWASPDLDQACQLMRRVFDHRDEARTRGEAARTAITAEFSREEVGRMMVKRLLSLDAGR